MTPAERSYLTKVEAERDRLAQERFDLAVKLQDITARYEGLLPTFRDVADERDRLAAALEKYGDHLPGIDPKTRQLRCASRGQRAGHHVPACTCGFDAARKGTP